MAGNDAVIRVLADITKAERGIELLVNKLNGIKTTVVDIQAGPGAVKAERVVGGLVNRLSTLGREAKTTVGQLTRVTEGVGAIVASGAALGTTSNALGAIANKAQAAAVALDNASDGIRSGFGLGGLKSLLSAASGQFEGFAASVQSTSNTLGNISAPIQAMIDGFSAIGPSATLAAGGIALLGAAMNDVLKKEVASIGENATAALRGMTDEVQALLRALAELNQQGGTLNQFKDLQKRGYARLNDNNSGTVEAAKAANTIVRAEEKITTEKKAQNDLLRAARGLQPQSVRDAEVARRQAFLTSGRNAQQTAAQQAKDVDQLQQALLKLEQASAELENGKLEERWKLDQAAAAKLREEAEALATQLQLMERAASNKGIRLTEASGRVQERKELEQSIKLIRERNALLQGNANQYRGMAGPGNDTRVNQPQYRAMVNQRAVTEASKTAQITYNWTQFLRQGRQITAELVALDAKDLKLQQARTAEAYEQLSIKKREEDFERRLARLRERKNTRQQNTDATNKKLEGVAIGGAFPLLFGGGAGSIIGGALGGLNTSNPIFSVFTSAIGQMLDQWVEATGNLAKGLKSPVDAMAALEAAGYKVDASTKNQVNRLIEVGRAYEAQTLVLAEVERKLGPGSVQALNALASEQSKLKDQWDELAGSLSGSLLPALVGATAFIGDLVKGVQGLSKIKLPGWLLAAINATNVTGQIAELLKQGAENRGKPIVAKADTRPALDPLVAQDAADKQLAAAERAEALRRQGLQLERQAQDLRLQIEDQVYGFRQRAADLERANLDLRRSIEDEIYKKRQDITRIEVDNARQQAQLAIERLDMQLAGTRVSGNAPGQDLANSLLDAVRQYVKTRAEGEADLQQKEKLHVIDMEELRRASEKFRFDVARKVADLDRQSAELTRDIERAKLTTARAIYDLQVAGADYQIAKAKENISLMVDANQRLAATGELGRAQSGGAFSKWDPALLKATGQLDQKYRVPLGTTASLVMFESSGNTAARGPDVGGGDRGHGLFQIMRGTARELGVNHQSILGMGGVQQMGLLDKYLMGRGFRPGMNPEQMYATVLGGNPWARSADLNGTTPGSGAAVQRGWRSSAAAAINAAGGAQMSPLFQRGGTPFRVGDTIPAPGTPAARPNMPASVGQADSALGGVKLPGPADVGALLTSLSALDQKLLSAKTNALEIAKAFGQLSKEKAAEALGNSVQSVISQLNAPLDQLLKSQADSAAYQREYAGLIEQGTAPALAEQLAQIRQQVQLQLEQLDTAVAQLEATKVKLEAEGKWTAELQTQLDLLRAQQGVIQGKGAAAEGNAIQDQKGKQIRDYMTRLKGELNDTDAMIVSLAGTIEGELGNAMSSAINGVITGTTTVEEAMSQMFKNIGAAFIEMATQMIAKALILKVLGIFGGGGGLFGGGGGGMSFFADGGFVTGPTNAMVGEGGANEYVIPENKMAGAMSRWSAGARGAAVVNGADPTGGGGATALADAPTQVSISGGVLNFNDSQYIRADQVPSIISQASKQGEALALRKLQMSVSTRRRIGV